MSHDERPASLRIFDEVRHAAIRGWRELKIAGHQAIARVNPHVGLMELWVTVTKPDGKGGEKLCYEQPKIFENQGVMVIIEDWAGRIGFVQNFRMIGHRPSGVSLTRYIEALQESPVLCEEALSGLGMWQWELPGGMTGHHPEHEKLSDQELIFEVARLEAREEMGCEMSDLEWIGWLHTETAYIPHPWGIVRGKVERRSAQAPEEHEFLGAVNFFTPREIRERIDDGSLGGASILAALMMVGIQVPPSPPK